MAKHPQEQITTCDRNEVVNGLALFSVPLAILPSGTANVLARELKLPRHPLKAVDAIPKLKPALGKCGDRHFVLMADAGLDATIIDRVGSRLKARLCRLAFGMTGVRQWSAGYFPQLSVSVDASHSTARLPSSAALPDTASPSPSLQMQILFDDSFKICLFRGASRPLYLKYLAGVLSATHEGFRDVICIRGQYVEITSEQPVPIQLDGELQGFTPATLDIIPNALTLLIP